MPLLHAFDFLAAEPRADVPACCAVFGDEPFLKRLAIKELRAAVLDGEDGEFSLSTFEGKVALREVLDELSTVALFGGGRRLVIVEDADDFVSANRAALEDYVSKPRSQAALVLELKQFPSNTKLAKAFAAKGLVVDCKVPAAAQTIKWLTTWTKRHHRAKLKRDAADLLLEIVGPELGLLDQELAKLAVSVGVDGEITAELVQELVGGWRAKTTWDMLDAAAAGDAASALIQLDRLLLSGEVPIAILAQIGSTLRRFAAAASLIAQSEASGGRMGLKPALEAAGVKPVPFMMNKAESQLRQIGRQRALLLYRQLLDADLALKGSSSAPARARIVLETLVARLSKTAAITN